MGTQSTGLVLGFARVFFAESARASARATSASAAGTNEEEGGAAASAIFMAVAAVEAQLGELAATTGDAKPEIAPLAASSEYLPTRFLKYLGYCGIDRKHVEASEEYKNLRCLVDLRNAMIHRSATPIQLGTFPPRLRSCAVRVPFATGRHDWTSRLLTADVARWCIECASAWLRMVEELVS